ncbi:MAG TPA: biotin--[acetyl-CoA-carboxylase] ligase [Pirellulaceae bacterium]|nr:biotin--[acetyl-CoA-carboxylase] ligase [Pirellulaceae bacterium]
MPFDLPRLYETGCLARIEHHDELGSTSDHALKLAAQDDLELPLLVVAERQTAGRGRGANRWWAADGALTFSLVIQPPPAQLPPANWPRLSLAAGLAICQALEAFAPQALFQVKWPNDVYAEGRKIAGILIESPAQSRGRLVIGIGINVNNSLKAAPDDIRSRATSLCDLDARARDLTSVLSTVLSELDVHLRAAADMASIRGRWQERCLLTGCTVQVQSGTETIAGRCLGIDEQGGLVLQTETGRRSVVSGTVVDWESRFR